jgi:SAM-dependent methyltransferase
MECRNCNARLTRVFCDLGTSPLSNGYLTEGDLDSPEPRFPLRPYLCDSCSLVQLPMFETPAEIFSEYAFFSGQSETWRVHCARLMQDLFNRRRESLGRLPMRARVLELASNDGTLLRHALHWTRNVTGVEPAHNIARHALLQGLPTINRFFDQALATELVADGYQADVIIANNVLAHVPDLDDFLGAARRVLAPNGLLIVEVPRLERLVEENQFDTIYHEHFSYFTLASLADVLARRGLLITDVEWLPTHGGSMRAFACHAEVGTHRGGFEKALAEVGADPAPLRAYAHRPAELKQRMLDTFGLLRHEGKRIAGYGAPAKATTFLTYCGIDHEQIEFIVDSTPAKQGLYQPGARIPILPPAALTEREPDVILILPHNWQDEIFAKIERDCPWGPMVLCRDKVLADGALAATA